MNEAEKTAFRRYYALRWWERDGGFAGDVNAAEIQVCEGFGVCRHGKGAKDKAKVCSITVHVNSSETRVLYKTGLHVGSQCSSTCLRLKSTGFCC
jgi:hypothetical protein